jgi:hypothetical protein
VRRGNVTTALARRLEIGSRGRDLFVLGNSIPDRQPNTVSK